MIDYAYELHERWEEYEGEKEGEKHRKKMFRTIDQIMKELNTVKKMTK